MTRIVPTRDYQPDKVGIIVDPVARQLWEQSHCECQLCGTTCGLQTHHLVGGVSGGRSDEPCNFLRTCVYCHMRCEGFDVFAGPVKHKRLLFGEQLWLKSVCDPHEWNPKRLKELYRMALPDLIPIKGYISRTA